MFGFDIIICNVKQLVLETKPHRISISNINNSISSGSSECLLDARDCGSFSRFSLTEQMLLPIHRPVCLSVRVRVCVCVSHPSPDAPLDVHCGWRRCGWSGWRWMRGFCSHRSGRMCRGGRMMLQWRSAGDAGGSRSGRASACKSILLRKKDKITLDARRRLDPRLISVNGSTEPVRAASLSVCFLLKWRSSAQQWSVCPSVPGAQRPAAPPSGPPTQTQTHTECDNQRITSASCSSSSSTRAHYSS